MASKTRNIAFDSFRCNVVKQVARFCCFSWTNLVPRVSLLSRDGKNGETLERDCRNYLHIEPARIISVFNLKILLFRYCIYVLHIIERSYILIIKNFIIIAPLYTVIYDYFFRYEEIKA